MAKLRKNRMRYHRELVKRSILFFALSATLCTAFIIFFNNSYGTLPALGKLLSPHLGIWQNGLQACKISFVTTHYLPRQLQSNKVSIDKNGVLHIMASNAADAYFLQGYMQARDRLWQMDFNAHIAEGRSAEIIGIKGLEQDKWMRKMDLKRLAKQMEALIRKDTVMFHICQAYADGVNAYIRQLRYAQYPVEYKIFSTRPEEWSIYKTALICKLFTYDWSSYERDVFRTQFIKVFGDGGYRIAFPDATNLDVPPFNPMISGMPPAIQVLPPIFKSRAPLIEFPAFTSPNPTYYDDVARVQPKIKKQDPNYPEGGYSFVLHAQKTKHKKALLASDIKQSLALPNYWYELQMAYPDPMGYVNAYGVSYPGLPGIMVGFNKDIAWSINASKIDNKDFLYVSFADALRTKYLYNRQLRNVRKQVEVYKIRGHKSERDTLFFTDMGVLFWDEKNTSNLDRYGGYVMRWKSSIAANDLKGFLLLNKAHHYLDYQSALLHIRALNLYVSYADKQGNTGMNMQGELPLRWKEQGRFLSPSAPAYTWNKIIDRLDLPYVLNSPFGFNFVASGIPFYQRDFPYYLSGEFEAYHSKRLYNRLRDAVLLDLPDVMRIMEEDTYNSFAEALLPLLLPMLHTLPSAGTESSYAQQALKQWDYRHTPNSEAASIFIILMQQLQRAIWDDELKLMNLYQKEYPPLSGTLFLLQNAAFFSKFIDNRKTSSVETLRDILLAAWKQTLRSVDNLKKNKKLAWAKYALAYRRHLSQLRSLGGESVITTPQESLYPTNRSLKAMGTTWKMVVEMSSPVRAYGYMAGGQSGNPCSPRYNNYAGGQLRQLRFLKDAQDTLSHQECLQTYHFHLSVPN